MALRKHREGELVIEQTRDIARLRTLLDSGGMITAGIEWPAACYLLAFYGDEAIGAIGVEPQIDAALIRSLYVIESMRRSGIGAALVAAARKAAHTRGARHLYLFSTEAGQFFMRLGFERVAMPQLLDALSCVPEVEYYRARPDELAREIAFHLDISRDGLIER
ncbi:MAG: GNAT family N-acetyltransferase [Candidatus Binatus sp.]|uniref:GNAT family N-acetyltransferase n=1 Tax=Candidatus Binatus sp. TaxID=2811406 RepID=UPI00271DD860|nr:GNAT family N-acetyltransferase [Candidatus Binatus sp.]MDO8433331.1 GNAT family N-acetyltransferase [Candidatus Binatus sp.]